MANKKSTAQQSVKTLTGGEVEKLKAKAAKGDLQAKVILAGNGGVRLPDPEPIVCAVEDLWGARTLIIPGSEVRLQSETDGSGWGGIVRDIEAMTGTRLKDGGNPLWFWRLHRDFNERRDVNSGIDFATYCRRGHPDKVDVAPPAGDDLVASELSALQTDDLKILRALKAKGAALKQVELEAETGITSRTIRDRLRSLRDSGLTRRPNGSHGGEAITPMGLARLAKISGN